MRLEEITLFQGVQNELVKNIKQSKRIYHKDCIIHEEGTVCEGIDVILSGKLVAYTLSENGNTSTLFEFGIGRVIGANLLFGDCNKYPLTICCVTKCELVQIKKQDIEYLLEHDQHFVKQYIREICINSQGMNQRINMYTQRNLRDKILSYFKLLALQQKSMLIELPMSKKELADYLGVQRPSLFRELKHMKEEGLLTINNRYIHLHIQK